MPAISAKSRASGASPFYLLIAASFSTSLVTMSSVVAVIVAFLPIMRSRKTFHPSFLGILQMRKNICSCLLILEMAVAESISASVSVVDGAVGAAQRL
jgi:hypothetical protein